MSFRFLLISKNFKFDEFINILYIVVVNILKIVQVIFNFLDRLSSWNIKVFLQIMNINDKSVLEMLNKLIAIDRLNKSQILQMVNLVSLSNDIKDLKDNLKWESSNPSY